MPDSPAGNTVHRHSSLVAPGSDSFVEQSMVNDQPKSLCLFWSFESLAEKNVACNYTNWSAEFEIIMHIISHPFREQFLE